MAKFFFMVVFENAINYKIYIRFSSFLFIFIRIYSKLYRAIFQVLNSTIKRIKRAEFIEIYMQYITRNTKWKINITQIKSRYAYSAFETHQTAIIHFANTAFCGDLNERMCENYTEPRDEISTSRGNWRKGLQDFRTNAFCHFGSRPNRWSVSPGFIGGKLSCFVCIDAEDPFLRVIKLSGQSLTVVGSDGCFQIYLFLFWIELIEFYEVFKWFFRKISLIERVEILNYFFNPFQAITDYCL